MKRVWVSLKISLLLLTLAQPLSAFAQISPADPNGRLPESALETLAQDPDAFTFGRALKNVTRRVAQDRVARAQLSEGERLRYAPLSVSGNYQVPVFAVEFSNTAAQPWAPIDLENALFGGTGATLNDYYDEVSGNRVNVTGTVNGWHALPQIDTYYAGTSNGLNPSNAKIGELIQHTLVANDGSVDFGQFDNDGPDGVPNSGDDDGYVDFVAFVHPEVGAECGGSGDNIWSHRWRYSSWNVAAGAPYVTSDPSANGGFILVDDYTIQPALSCDGVSMIEIGVFCHEFGHAFDLPDLYDINGGGPAGLGHWCLMASGNWNSPSQPGHMSAWSKWQLGWLSLVEVDWQGTTVSVQPVQTSEQAYRLTFDDDRWRRSADCVLDGLQSLSVGLTVAESQARGWAANAGYGNGWMETVVHDFEFDGVGPVSLDYDYGIDTESGFDFAFVIFETGGVESTLAVYDGSNGGMGSHDLTALLGAAPTDYKIKFRFRSDAGWSNEDGLHVASCAPFAVDNIQVSGGGENYVADFEQHLGGWYQPVNETDNPISEFWLVENRQATGFDSNLHGTGLMVYHVDQEILDSSLQNSGGASETAARGVVLEEADGLFDLIAAAGNRGDAGDPFPGSAMNYSFDSLSTPASNTNSGAVSRIGVTGVVVQGSNVQATFEAGNPAPQLTSVSPFNVPSDSLQIDLELQGLQNTRHGAQVRLVQSGQPDIVPSQLDWLDYDRMHVELDLTAAAHGYYDVVVENPDGQTAVVVDGFRIASTATDAPPASNLPGAFALAQNYPNPFNPSTTIRFELPKASQARLEVFDVRGRVISTLHRGLIPAGYHEARWDGTDDSGSKVASGIYFVRLSTPEFSDARKMLLAK